MRDYVGSLHVQVSGDPNRDQRHLVLEALHRCNAIQTARYTRDTSGSAVQWGINVTLEWEVISYEARTLELSIQKLHEHMMKTPFF